MNQRERQTLRAAVRTFAVDHPAAIGVLIGADRACFARLAPDGRLLDHTDAEVNAGEFYEARAFDASAELRWYGTTGGTGRWAKIKARPSEEGEVHFQLLWGRVVEWAQGWSRLFEARVGSLWVPFEDPAKRYIRLRSIARLGRDSAHGNVYVADERLVGLEGYEPGNAAGD